MKKSVFKFLIILATIYTLMSAALFTFQEKMIFFPDKLRKDYQFSFTEKFEELNIRMKDGKHLNALLFTSDNSKGVIFYLHGNAGALNSWGHVAKTYTDLNHDLFVIDYRGYGKSEGAISSEKQLYEDLQVAYEEVKTRYTEDKIIVLGYSIGTGPAAKIAADNNPKLLILQAPYHSLTDMMKHYYPMLPTFILKYKFDTYKYVQECKMPVVIFHGDQDEVIYYESSVKLKKVMKETDRLITLKGQRHNGMTENPEYVRELSRVLHH
jgi:uncharacterized protein